MSDDAVRDRLDLDSVLPYVKALANQGPDAGVPVSGPTVVTRAFVGSLVTTYVVDVGVGLEYVADEVLRGVGVSVEDLHRQAVRNFAALVAEQGVRMPRYQAITPVLFDGNFEVSVMLLDDTWAWFEAQFGEPEILAVAPARDILAFCPGGSEDGRTRLGELIDRVWPGADHRLTRDFYRRVNGTWTLDRPHAEAA